MGGGVWGAFSTNKDFASVVVKFVLVHVTYCRSGLKSDHIP